MKTIKIFAVVSTALVAFAAAPYAAATDQAVSGDHAAMAQQLQLQAAVANQKADVHEQMARRGGSPKAAPGAMKRHCDELVAQYRAEAAKYTAEAIQHQQQAGSAALTRDQHLALAQEFDAKAAVANEKVAAHEAMSRRSTPKGNQLTMSNHCEQLIAQYKAEAEAYATKAAEHRLAAR